MRDPVPKKKVESNRLNHPTTGDRVRRQHRDRDGERQKKTQKERHRQVAHRKQPKADYNSSPAGKIDSMLGIRLVP